MGVLIGKLPYQVPRAFISLVTQRRAVGMSVQHMVLRGFGRDGVDTSSVDMVETLNCESSSATQA
tara:strand:+ start:310 stop:504 length:195 start_codon:yes stop_codon:yes gene_type:complete